MTDRIRLDGRVAVVTGAAGVIGTATMRLLAERGARLVAVDRREQDLKEAVKDLPASAQALAVAADVTDEDEVAGYVRAAVETFGTIDAFYNNAGIEGDIKPITDYSLEMFRRVLDVNVVGVFLGMKHVLPVMLKQNKGSIINTASIAGLMGSPHIAVYSASKHAVIGLTKSAAWECTGTGVRVNCVCPGLIDSRMLSTILQGRNPGNTPPPKTRSSTRFRRGGSDTPPKSPPSSHSSHPTRQATSRARPTPSMADEPPPRFRRSGAMRRHRTRNDFSFKIRRSSSMPAVLDPDAAAVFKAFQEAGRPPYETVGHTVARELYLAGRVVSNPEPPELEIGETAVDPRPARIDPRAHLHAETAAGRRPRAGAGVLSRRRLGDRRSRFP